MLFLRDSTLNAGDLGINLSHLAENILLLQSAKINWSQIFIRVVSFYSLSKNDEH